MSNVFKWRHFQPVIILQCVRWYLKYGISYRDLEEMMEERGVSVNHTTIYRWVMMDMKLCGCLRKVNLISEWTQKLSMKYNSLISYLTFMQDNSVLWVGDF